MKWLPAILVHIMRCAYTLYSEHLDAKGMPLGSISKQVCDTGAYLAFGFCQQINDTAFKSSR